MTYPWTLSSKTYHAPDLELKLVHPILPFFGGRSLYWSAWVHYSYVQRSISIDLFYTVPMPIALSYAGLP